MRLLPSAGCRFGSNSPLITYKVQSTFHVDLYRLLRVRDPYQGCSAGSVMVFVFAQTHKGYATGSHPPRASCLCSFKVTLHWVKLVQDEVCMPWVRSPKQCRRSRRSPRPGNQEEPIAQRTSGQGKTLFLLLAFAALHADLCPSLLLSVIEKQRVPRSGSPMS